MEVMFTFPYQQLLYFFLVLPYISNPYFSVNGTFLVAGWAFTDSVIHRLVPLWVGTRGLEFTWDYILQGLEANTNLVRYFS
ncbi:hypothetical protein AHAS_Ahas03G0157400 [Arachis hypogaea]